MTIGGRSGTGAPTNAGDPPPLPSPQLLRRRRGFARHLLAYLVAVVLLVAVWLAVGIATGSWFFWPVFVLIGWGLVLDGHAWWAYGRPSRRVTDAPSRR